MTFIGPVTVTRAYRNGSFLPPSPRSCRYISGPPAQADVLNGLQQIEGGDGTRIAKLIPKDRAVPLSDDELFTRHAGDLLYRD